MRKKKIYKASPGAQFNPKKAQDYGEELEKIAKENNGRLEPKIVIENARDENSVLHACFNWDDSIAAKSWRRQQARALINHIEIVIQYENEEKTTKAFVNLVVQNGEEEEKSKYIPIEIVAKDEELRKQLIEEALKEIISWKKRYKEYQELALIFGAIKEVQSELSL